MSTRDTAIELSVEIATAPAGLRHQTLKLHTQFVDTLLAAAREQVAGEVRATTCKRCERLTNENADLKRELSAARALIRDLGGQPRARTVPARPAEYREHPDGEILPGSSPPSGSR